MVNMQEINNVVLKQSQEHKIILDYVSRFDETMLQNKREELLALINTISGFLQKDLINHFAMEENIFFPAAIYGHPKQETLKLVFQLQKEHGTLEKDLERIIKTIKFGKTHQANVEKELLELFEPFLYDLKKHARIEIEELFPLLANTQECQNLIAKYFDESPDENE